MIIIDACEGNLSPKEAVHLAVLLVFTSRTGCEIKCPDLDYSVAVGLHLPECDSYRTSGLLATCGAPHGDRRIWTIGPPKVGCFDMNCKH